nr:MAG TPA: hypothetical protein [Caudoviricetes sp.]
MRPGTFPWRGKAIPVVVNMQADALETAPP